MKLDFKHKANQNRFLSPHNIQYYIGDRIDTIYNPICYDNIFNNSFKSLLRFLKENGFPYKCRLYGNSQFATNCYTVVLYYRMFKYSLCKKSALLLSGLASMTFLRDTLVWATAYYVFIVSIHIPDRWQSKTLMLSTNVDQIPSETDFLDCSLFA